MPATSFWFGIAMIIWGGYLFYEHRSPTAAIPAAFGAAFLLLGLLASLKPALRKHAMHFAAMVGLIGCIGGLAMGLPKLEMIRGTPPERPEAVKAQILLGAVCGVFVLLCVKSFIDARVARKDPNQPPAA